MSDLIKTKRLSLSVLNPVDAPDIQAYYARNEAHLARWEPARSKGFHSESAWRQRGENAQAEFQAGSSLRLVARLHSDPHMIAACNFTNIVRGPYQACTLGFSVDPAYQGQGLMFEAINAGLDYVFNTLGLHRVEANHLPENERSAALLQRLGFQREGFAKSYLHIAGEWRDHVLTAKINPKS